MRFCKSHWEELQKGIKEAGLFHLVHQSGDAAADAQMRELTGQSTPEDYDPLLSAHWAIVSNSLQLLGLELMIQTEEGDGHCPLCFAKQRLEEHVQTCTDPKCRADQTLTDLPHWIDHAVNGQLQYAREQGLVSVQ